MARNERTREYWAEYTRDLTPADFQKLFTRDTPEAYRYFVRGLDVDKLVTGPWYRRWWMHTKIAFHAFTRRLTPARRLLYAVGIGATLLGLLNLFRGFGFVAAARLGQPVGASATLGPGHVLDGDRLRGRQSADAHGGRGSAVAQRRARDRARHPARDAAVRRCSGRRRHGLPASRARRTPSAAISTTSRRCRTGG